MVAISTGSTSPNGLKTLANQATGVATVHRQRMKQTSRRLMKLVLKKYRNDLNWRETAKDNKIPFSIVYRWAKMDCDDDGVPNFNFTFQDVLRLH